MKSKVIIVLFNILIFSELLSLSAKAQTSWIRVGYWYSSSNQRIPVSEINSALFTHLVCAFAYVNSTSYQIFLSPSDEETFSKFTATVKQKNPSVNTLLSIGGINVNDSTFSSMVSNFSNRKSFVDSSIKIARMYDFQGLDLSWLSITRSSDMYNVGILFGEWKAAVDLDSRLNSSQSQLILTAQVYYLPKKETVFYPIESMQQYLNWVHVITTDYSVPTERNFTDANAALYDPSSDSKTDYGITTWTNAGLSTDKLVFCLPFYGSAWTLVNPEDNGIGAPATGTAINTYGDPSYKQIKNYIKRYGDNNVRVIYNATYVVNYCSIGRTWIGFDDVESIRAKISYAKEKKLRGYCVWEVSFDDNWVLSKAAAEVEDKKINGRKKRWLFVIILPVATAGTLLLLGYLLYYWWMKKLKSQGKLSGAAKASQERANNPVADTGDFKRNNPNLREYSLADIVAATERFSIENKLGEGGYGPVYKGILQNGEAIAVKKLSKTSTQGFEEFKNEVMLTAKLQHVNLVRVLGFCIDQEEHMLIYEYMPNKSLDCYLFDPIRRFLLDWTKRVHIIEGITQGLLYLQEYSRMTIIHRDLKASNVLLAEDMTPKISDFGIARIFVKYELEANTERIVGTIGYIPPEYARRGIYSTKSDVYSFGVLLLQIISGKRLSILYGMNEDLSLLAYAYELWKDGKGMEFVDLSLDDTCSSCKLIRCLQVALLCVQDNPIDRPSMLEVSSMLKNETTYINIPKKPAFSIRVNEGQQNKSPIPFEVCSINDAAISEVTAR